MTNTPSAGTAQSGERQAATSRAFRATRDEVFDAFADPARLARWWGPTGFSNTFQAFEFQPGGAWRFVMHGPDGSHYPNASVFTEIARPERIVFNHISAPHFEMRITLEEREGGTQLTWTQTFDTPEAFASLKALVTEANEQNLDRLDAELRRRS